MNSVSVYLCVDVCVCECVCEEMEEEEEGVDKEKNLIDKTRDVTKKSSPT